MLKAERFRRGAGRRRAVWYGAGCALLLASLAAAIPQPPAAVPGGNSRAALYFAPRAVWTGYIQTYPLVRPDSVFYEVLGQWVVPAVKCAGILGRAANLGIWVGLGGYGAALPFYQTGIGVRCDASAPVYYAWHERFTAPKDSRNPDQAPKPYPGDNPPAHPLVVAPGDRIVADVRDAYGVYTMAMRNLTRGWMRSVVFGPCDDTPPGVSGTCVRFDRGDTIEAVTENSSPDPPGRPNPYPLFNPFRFTVYAATNAVRLGIFRTLVPVFQPFGKLAPFPATQADRFPFFGGFLPGGVQQASAVSAFDQSRSTFWISDTTSVCTDFAFSACIPLHS